MPRCKAARSELRSILEKVCEGERRGNAADGRFSAELSYPFSGKLFDILMRGSVVPSASWSCSILACL